MIGIPKSIASDFNGIFDSSAFHLELAANGTLAAKFDHVDTVEDAVSVCFTSELDAAEQAELDACVSAHSTLDRVKAVKIAEIDARTSELIGNGFVYGGQQFSLTIEAQTKMAGVHQVKDDEALTYPIRWNNKDDSGAYEIQNSADLRGFYLQGLGTVRAHLDSGTALKDQVRAATTVAEVDAVVDNR